MAASFFKLKILRRSRPNPVKTPNISEEKQQFKNLAADNKCRVCLKEGTIPIYGNTSDISDSLRIFGDIEINQNDDFPKQLCVACYSLLQSAILFKKTAKQTDKLLRENYKISLLADFNDIVPSPETKEIHKEDISKTYMCKICKQEFKTSNELFSHKKTKRHNNIRVQCSKCKRLLTPQSYRKHLLRHQSASHLICEVCGKMYRKDNLVRHLQLHSFELPFQCQICPYKGRFLESLKIHMRTHTGNKPFSCGKCESRFLTRSNLNRHILTHKKERPFKCNECHRGFCIKRDLEVHFKSDHSGIMDYGCRICGAKYGTRKAVMRHELRVHRREKLSKGRTPLYLQIDYQKGGLSSLKDHEIL